MAHAPAVRRRLFMHPAHQTVGISGDGMSRRPYCRVADFSTGGWAVRPTIVALAAYGQDADADAAIRSFEQAIRGRSDLRCRRVGLDTRPRQLPSLADSDCVVVFGRGLHVARCWTDLDDALMADGPRDGRGGPMEVEVAMALAWHPILEGVEPFVSRRGGYSGVRLPTDATVLLYGKTGGTVLPLAWLDHLGSRVFHSILGSPEDFRQPGFIRLVLNAIAWLG
jgi:hypothetical protein